MSASPRRGGAPHGALVINGHKGGTVNQHVRLRPVVLLLLAAVVAVFGLVWAMDAMGSESPAADTSAAAAADGGKVIYRVGWTREPDNLNPFVGYTAPAFEIWYSPTTRSSATTPARSRR